tara:strand:+ start:4045 stop:5733 length:1689 start_codon:yes stop_codon:yes gene_type:complete
MNNKLVSIIMPTYNDAKYLHSAINDILEQTYKNFELIIVNDGSTDNTSDILKQYEKLDDRIQVYEKENGGTGSALNYGFEKARGFYGTWVSSDDNKDKTYLEKLVRALDHNPDIEYAVTAYYSKFLGKIHKPFHYNKDLKQWVFCRNPTGHDDSVTNSVLEIDDWAGINQYNCYQGVCFLFTMRLKKKCGDYITIPGEDYHMSMLMGMNSKTIYIDECLGTHNNPPDSLSMEDRSCTFEAEKITKSLYFDNPDKWYLKEIPKIAHFYWGGTKMSFMRYLTIKTFKENNPDWSIYLYRGKEYKKSASWQKFDNHHQSDSFSYTSEENYYQKLKQEIALRIIEVDFSRTPLGSDASEVHKSDYIRWYALVSKGGLWSDMDIIYHKSITDIKINKVENMNTEVCMCYDPRHKELAEMYNQATNTTIKTQLDSIPIGFMMSGKGSRIFKKIGITSRNMIEKMKGQDMSYQAIGTYAVKSIFPTLESMLEVSPNKVKNIDYNEVYSIDFQNLEQLYENNNFESLKDQTIGFHWYGGHPLSQKYNNLYNENTWANYDNTFSAAIKGLS